MRKDLGAIGLKVNTYGTCVFNKMINDKNITIAWHVNDLKVSHAEKDIIESFIQWTKETYEDVTKLNP